MHSTHNFEVIAPLEGAEGEEVAIAGAEGIARAGLGEEPREFVIDPKSAPGFGGAGEVRFELGTKEARWRYATVEPMHGNVVAVYSEKDGGGLSTLCRSSHASPSLSSPVSHSPFASFASFSSPFSSSCARSGCKVCLFKEHGLLSSAMPDPVYPDTATGFRGRACDRR